MPSLIDIIFRRVPVQPDIPVCPDHKTEMRLRGKLGKPTSDPRYAAYEDILWAMLNSSEFAFNH